MNDGPVRIPFLILYGTVVELIWAADARHASEAFLGLAFADSPHGRLAPPDADELVVRPLRADDAGWIEDAHAPAAFREALRSVDR